jgi:hypothetical protein
MSAGTAQVEVPALRLPYPLAEKAVVDPAEPLDLLIRGDTAMLRKPLSRKKAICSSVSSGWKSVVGFTVSLLA